MSVLDLQNHPSHGFDIIRSVLIAAVKSLTGNDIELRRGGIWGVIAEYLRHIGISTENLEVKYLLVRGEPMVRITLSISASYLNQLLGRVEQKGMGSTAYYASRGELDLYPPANWRELPVPPMPDSLLAAPW